MKTILSLFCSMLIICACSYSQSSGELIDPPAHGFLTKQKAKIWEESLVCGNGTLGALVLGDPQKDRIILSHERLFMPEYPPTEAPNLASRLDEIKKLVLDGKGKQAAEVAVELGKKVGINGLIWTDPLIPACQLEIEALREVNTTAYARSLNYETGEAVVAWNTKEGKFERKVFSSRPDKLVAMKMIGPSGGINIRMRLATLPVSDEEMDYEAEDFVEDKLIESVESLVDEEGTLSYRTIFKKQWDGSLKGYFVESRVSQSGGTMSSKDGWLYIKGSDEILVLSRVLLSYELPIATETDLAEFSNPEYTMLLDKHSEIQGEMFNRFRIDIEGGESAALIEDMQSSSSYGNLNPQYLNKLCDAARYLLISSTGELPPTLQGIWGGTWRPAWSGDFTLNGNVPSAISSGLNTNFREVNEAYMNYMYSMYSDFKDNARDLYDAPGIFVPSRTSSSGKTYHYAEPYPHLFWYACGAWTSQFFYDYWQYTGDEDFLKEKALPFMLDALAFYEHILTKDEAGKYNFIPSYSPEIGPIGHHPVVINATMDVAALKQLIRNLLELEHEGYLKKFDTAKWTSTLKALPEYTIDEDGDLNEWIWPGLRNNNNHRHASHLYPLFYEVDPEFYDRPELIEAAKTAINNRLDYRRDKNGGEMAFGLVQLGLAAAHIGDVDHAYECIDWLCNSYWSPALTSYHNPGEIFNVDISGGLPGVVTEMLLQSSKDVLVLLPALPSQWSAGSIRGVGTRCGVTADLEWKNGKPETLHLKPHLDRSIKIRFNDRVWEVEAKAGKKIELNFSE